MSAHLGPAASAFLDGALDHGRRDEVLAHLAHCATCRAELDVQRGLRVAMRQLPGPSLPGSLAERLLAVARPDLARPDLARPDLARPDLDSAVGCPRRPSRARRPHRRGVRRAAVSGALLALGIGGTLGLAGPPPRGPLAPVDPSSAQFVRDHSSTATEVPFDEPDVASVSLDVWP